MLVVHDKLSLSKKKNLKAVLGFFAKHLDSCIWKELHAVRRGS